MSDVDGSDVLDDGFDCIPVCAPGTRQEDQKRGNEMEKRDLGRGHRRIKTGGKDREEDLWDRRITALSVIYSTDLLRLYMAEKAG